MSTQRWEFLRGALALLLVMCASGAGTVTAQSLTVTHLAGSLGGPGSIDGTGEFLR